MQPATDEEAYHHTRWWLDHVENYGKNKAIGRGKGKARKELTPQQKAERKRFFITQAQKNKKPNYGIPSSSQHKEFFKNHQGAQGGKAKQKTKHNTLVSLHHGGLHRFYMYFQPI